MKRLIVLCDGTGNSATRCSKTLCTNVKRLADALDPLVWELACKCSGPPRFLGSRTIDAQALRKPKPSPAEVPVPKAEAKSKPKPKCPECGVERLKVPQIVYYQSGVGTSTGMSDISQTWQEGTGAGINDNILDGYHFLANNYLNGDEIFIFGFSRGAFTARVLANLVAQLGLFYKERLWMMVRAWDQYIKPDNGISFKYFVKKLWEVDSSKTRVATVKVLGVWDTVDSVGAPDYIENNKVIPKFLKGDDFYQPDLVYGIEHCFHALAIDEIRRTFNPTLFFLPDPEEKYLPKQKDQPKPGQEKEQFPPIVLRQCWFPGVHSNIGGSYPSEHLADITLAWMMDQCIKHGDLLVFNPFLLEKLVTRHLNPKENRDDYHIGGDDEYPGWGCGTIYDSYSGKKSFVTWQYRTPGNYCASREHRGSAGMFQLPEIKLPKWVPFLGSSAPTPSEDVCTDCIHPGRYSHYEQGATNETIHASVFARYTASIDLEKPENEEKRKKLIEKEKLKVLNDDRNKDKYWPFHETVKAVSLLKWDPGALAAFKREGTQTGHDAKLDRYHREKDPQTNAWIWTGRCLKTGKKFHMWEEPDSITETCGLANPFSENGRVVYKAESPVGEMISRLKGEVKKDSVYPQSVWTEEMRKKGDEDHKYLKGDFTVPKDYMEAELKRRKTGKDKRT